MKKLIIALMLVFVLGACQENEVVEVPKIEFDGELTGQLFTYGEFLHLDMVPSQVDYHNASLVIGERELPFVEGVNGFTLSDVLKEGFFLPSLEVGEYDFYIKTSNGESEQKYSLKDEFNFTFYPIKREGYKKIQLTENKLVVTAIDALPEDVYDIVIDPGHGGMDSGAVGKFDGEVYTEEVEVLEVSLRLEKLLQDAGYKVKLTRYVDEYPGNVRDMFGEGGRIQMLHEANPKLVYSLHLNSHPQDRHGFEIYCTSRGGVIPSFIVEELSKISQSSNSLYHKASDGVYSRFLSESDIKSWQESLAEREESKRYEMFEVLLTSKRKVDYYAVVRELGALATDAYEDGRRPDRAENKYRESVYGVEAVLVEMAFIDDREDFFRFKENYDGFAKALRDSFINYVNTDY